MLFHISLSTPKVIVDLWYMDELHSLPILQNVDEL